MNRSTASSSSEVPLVRAILGLRDTGQACQNMLRQLPSYVEAEVGGYAHRPEFKTVQRHVLLCPDCQPMYLDLLTVAIADQRGEL